jgi:hypothetical protein
MPPRTAATGALVFLVLPAGCQGEWADEVTLSE